jgi:hypothetical protein
MSTEPFAGLTGPRERAWLATQRELEAINAELRRYIAQLQHELLQVKGACSNSRCRLHFGHIGPCLAPSLS